MAYRLDGSDDQVAFTPGAMLGYAAGPVTVAIYVKRGTTAGNPNWMGADGQLGAQPLRNLGLGTQSTNRLTCTAGTGTSVGPVGGAVSNTTTWHIACWTWTGAGGTPRFHTYNGSSWNHGAGTVSMASNASAVSSVDRLRLGSMSGGSAFFNGDICVAGIKQADSSDAAVETLSPTLFQAWTDFGFDSLVGLEDSATQTDRTGGGGDEASRVGTTLVSDPPGWEWTVAGVPDPAATDWVPVWNLAAPDPASSVPAGGTIGQILAKTTAADFAAAWQTALDAVAPAATPIVQSKLLEADTQPAVRILGDGKLELGPGGATAPDTNLYRSAADTLKTDDTIESTVGFRLTGGSASFSQRQASADGTITLGFRPAASANDKFTIGANGAMAWGPGTAGTDVQVSRHGGGLLGLGTGHGLSLTEAAADYSAPAANGVRIYARDNGAGKTQLVARFNTGAVVVIATEP